MIITAGVVLLDGQPIPTLGGPWLLGQLPVVRVAYVGALAAPRGTSRWTGTSWAPAPTT